MTKQVQLRRGTAAEHAVFTGAVGELTIDTTNNVAVVHDGYAQGGFPLVGTYTTQELQNKTAIGIGTSGVASGLFVVGPTRLDGNLTATIDPTIVTSGYVDYDPFTRTITGVTTDGVKLGDRVAIKALNHPDPGIGVTVGAAGTSGFVSSIGSTTITLQESLNTGYAYTTTGYFAGRASAPGEIRGISTDGAGIGYVVRVKSGGENVADHFVQTIGIGTLFLTTDLLNQTNGLTDDLGTTQAGSDIITGVTLSESGVTLIVTGMTVIDLDNGTSNLPAGTKVTEINPNGLSGAVRISNNAILSTDAEMEFRNIIDYQVARPGVVNLDVFVDRPTGGLAEFTYIKSQQGASFDGPGGFVGFLTVTGDSYISGNLDVGAGLSVGAGAGFGTGITIGGATTISNGDLFVGLSTIRQDGEIRADLIDVNQVTASGDVNASGVLRSFGSLEVDQSAEILGSITGFTTLAGGAAGLNVLYVNSGFSTFFTISNAFTATTGTISSEAFMQGTLDVTGQSTLNGGLRVNSPSYMNGISTFNDDVYIVGGHGVQVAGGATFGSEVGVGEYIVQLDGLGSFYAPEVYAKALKSHVGAGLSIYNNVTVTEPGIITATSLNVTGDRFRIRSGNRADYLADRMTGVNTLGIYPGDVVQLAQDPDPLYTIKEGTGSAEISRIEGTTIFFSKMIERTGGLVTTFGYYPTANSNTIIGIDTSNIVVGYGVSELVHLADTTTVQGIGQSSVTLSASATNSRIGRFNETGSIGIGSDILTGVTTANFVIGDRVENPSAFSDGRKAYVLEILTGSVGLSTVSQLAVNSGTFQVTEELGVYFGETSGISTTFVIRNDNFGRILGKNIVAENELHGITTSYFNTARINTGIITSLEIENANVVIGTADTLGVTTAMIGDAFINAGIVTNLNVETSYVDTANINAGIVTDLHADNAYLNNAFINAGIATVMNATNAYNYETYTQIGVTTTGHIENAYIGNLNANVAISTTLQAGIGTVDTLGFATAIGDALGVSTITVTDIHADVGFITAIQGETFYINVGLTTELGVTTSRTDLAYINSGIITTAGIESGRVDNLYFDSGIGTHLGITTGTFDSVAISSVYANVGVFTDVQIQGNNIADSANFQRGVIGILTVTEKALVVDQKNTGVSTFGSATFNGVGQTTFHMTGDMRVSGEVKIGIGTTGITIDGDSTDIVGVSTFVANAGIMSSLTLSGINSTTNLSRSVTLRTSNSGVATDYTLTLPARLGKVGQVLSLQEDNTIGFNTGGQGLYENRYYVSAVNGSDTNDGKTLPTKTIKRAAQLASFDSFVIPGQRYLDAGDLMENNKDFIVDEVVGKVEFNYENIGVATIFPDYDQAIWKTYVGDTLDDLIYNIRFGGNNQIRARAVGFGTTTFSTTTEPALYAFEYLRYITQYVVNNQTPPTFYSDPSVTQQTFDFTITQDPENNNANYFNRNKSARILLSGNRQEIIDKSLASVAIGVTDVPSFYFPGDDGPVTDRSRFYTAYRLIQKNRQEIIDYAWAATVATYPGISSTETKCKRDLGYFVDAISTDIFCGSNEYARRFMGFYFDANGNPTGNGLLGEETESVFAFTEAAVGMSSAVCNLLAVTDLTAPNDPLTGNNNGASNCANVRSTITTLTGIVTTTVAAGSTSGISTTPNYGYFVVDYETNVRGNVGIATTMVTGGRKCARDLGYIIDAVTMDISFGSNQHIQRATKFYFDGAGNPKTDGLVAEEAISGYAFTSLAYYAKKAITNQLNFQDFTRPFDAGIGTNKGDLVCANTQATIDNLVGILTTAVLSGSLAGIPTSINFGVADCADVRSSIYNYVGIVTTAVSGIGSVPAETLPQTQSQPVCIFVEAGNYVEDNPIILYDDIAVVGDNLRNTIIRPLNQGKDLFRVRNGMYLTGFAMKDAIDSAGIPQSTWNFAVAFDDPADTSVSRLGYATKLDKPIISRSPYIQNCSILSFLGGNGILVDGAKVQSPNTPIIKEEVELNADSVQPEQGKSMVAAAFTMVSFGGIGWRVINDGYSQVVSCFQIFCRYGSLAQSGGYLSITNSATNFGFYSLRATGFSRNSFRFDRGRVAATGTSGGLQTLKAVGYGRSDIDNYILRFFDDSLVDRTNLFKPTATSKDFNATTAVNTVAETLTITNHGFTNGDAVVYNGDEQVIPNRIIQGLVNDNQYYIGYIDANTIQLYEDDSLQLLVDLQSTGGGGIHTLTKASQDFFATDVTDAHNSYQRITLAGIGSTAIFQSGRLVQQTVPSGTAIGYAVTYDQSSRELLVGLELSSGLRRPFDVAGNTISDHSPTPVTGIGVTVVAGITTYWTVEFKVDSTTTGNQILNIANLPETYRLHFHRPSIVNSSAHTWEYSGSGIDYNALPENGGQTDTTTEQVSELGGRVYSSGTNELGDFKVGDAITAFNRTGNIIFNNTVTIGTLDSIRLSLSGGAVIEEFSTDVGLGDNETGGAKNTRISTQLAIRSFLNNRLGTVLDKTVSTNAIPNAIVQLNAIGQINADLVPPRTVNYFRATFDGGRIQLVNLIPATNLNQGDTVVEPTDSFVLISDLLGQYLILDSTNDANTPLVDFDFRNGDTVTSAVTGGGAVGLVTGPPGVGVGTGVTTVDPAVGYGTTGLVKGVPLAVTNLQGGSGYSNPGIYTGVRLDQTSGIGTGTSATITIGPSGNVTNVAIQTGGFRYAVGNTLTLNDSSVIGGRVGGSNFTIDIGEVETRLYLALQEGPAGTQKFPGSTVLPDYIADRNAVGYSTNIGAGVTNNFVPTDYLVSGNVDFANDRIVLGNGHGFVDGDPVIYTTNGGVQLETLLDNETYYVKTVGVTSVQLYTTYSLTTIKSLTGSGTGTHSLSRVGVHTATDQIVFINHGFTQGDAVRVTNDTPIGVTTGNFYYIGSRTTNSFTLHTTRQQALDSVNGLILNTIDLAAPKGANVGVTTFTEQNVVYSKSVNTSSSDVSNFSLLSSSSLDASNIISGTFDPARLGSGTANSDVALFGDSSYKKVIKSVGIGTTQPIGVTYTSADLAPNGVGVNTYYGDIQMTLNRVVSTPDDYSTVGISKFKLSTFAVGNDGEITIKSSGANGGDVDAATLGGQNGAYYLDINNSTGQLSIARGGTGLGALPGNGSMLIGNGSTYTLTGSPSISGTMSGGFTVLGGKDITFTNSTNFSGDSSGRIQLYNNSLYLQYNTSIIFRESTGGNEVANINASGNFTSSGDFSFRRGTFTQATGTAPFSVSSTTVVTNLNSDLLDGIQSTSFLRSDADDTVANNLSFTSVTSPITTNSILFNNSENDGTYYTDAQGVLAFDENFSTDSNYGNEATAPAQTFTTNGGGLVVKNEDGWGAVLSSQNIRWCEGNFANLQIGGNQVFHAGNDGPGSNLDADTLDGVQGDSFLRSDANDSFSGNLTGSGTILTTGTYMGITGNGGGIVMTTNDGYGNCNLTFNHRSGRPDQNGNAFRIETNVDSNTGATMAFELKSNVTANTPVAINNTGMVLTETELTVSGEVVSTSDIRTKTDIQNLESCLDKVLRLRPVSYLRTDLPDDKTHIGLIAQEVQEVYPEVVAKRKDDEYLGVAYQQLVPALIGAIQELKSEVDSLRNEVRELKGE